MWKDLTPSREAVSILVTFAWRREKEHGTFFFKRPDKIKKLISGCWQQNIRPHGVCVFAYVCSRTL